MWAQIITIRKSVLDATLDGINRQCHNGLFQRVGMPRSIQFHLLWHSPNGPMVNVSAITTFLAILERRSNGRDDSNGHISPPWGSANLHYFAIPAKFKLCKPSFCEFLSGNSCNFPSFAFFLLSFLAFFPVICISGFLFPFLFLSPLGIVTSHS